MDTAPLAAGTYSFQGTYAGDANHTGSMDACESFTVAAAPPPPTPTPTPPSTVPPSSLPPSAVSPAQEVSHPSEIVTDLGRPTHKNAAGSLIWPLGGGLVALLGMAGVALAVRRLRGVR
jgi:hypothetical protein